MNFFTHKFTYFIKMRRKITHNW